MRFSNAIEKVRILLLIYGNRMWSDPVLYIHNTFFFTVCLPGWGCAGWSLGHRRTLSGAPWSRAAADSWRNPRPCRCRSNHANWVAIFLALWQAEWFKALTQPWLNTPCLIHSANTIKSPPWSRQNVRRALILVLPIEKEETYYECSETVAWWSFRKSCLYKLYIDELKGKKKRWWYAVR